MVRKRKVSVNNMVRLAKRELFEFQKARRKAGIELPDNIHSIEVKRDIKINKEE